MIVLNFDNHWYFEWRLAFTWFNLKIYSFKIEFLTPDNHWIYIMAFFTQQLHVLYRINVLHHQMRLIKIFFLYNNQLKCQIGLSAIVYYFAYYSTNSPNFLPKFWILVFFSAFQICHALCFTGTLASERSNAHLRIPCPFNA